MPSIVLVTNRTAPSQKPMLQPLGCELFEKGNDPSIVWFWPKLMFSNVPTLLANDQPGPSVSLLGGGKGASCPAVQSVVFGTPHTADEPMNMLKVGIGADQLVSRLAEYGVGVPTPVIVFSLIRIVLLAPSAMAEVVRTF